MGFIFLKMNGVNTTTEVNIAQYLKVIPEQPTAIPIARELNIIRNGVFLIETSRFLFMIFSDSKIRYENYDENI